VRKFGLIRFLALICIILILATSQGKGHPDKRIDSLFNQLRKVDDTTRIDLFNELAQLYWERSFDSSLMFATHALSLAEKSGDKLRIANSLNMTGNAYYMLSDYTRSLDYYQRALTIRQELGDSNDIARTLNNIGAVHLQTRNYETSLDYFNRALQIYSGLGKDEIVLTLTNNIGGLYLEQKNYEKAMEYLQKVYDLATEVNNEKMILISLNNLGEVSGSLGLYNQALQYFEKARRISESKNDINMLATVFLNTGAIYVKKGRSDLSFRYFNDALKYAEVVNSISLKRDIYKSYYDIYNSRNNYEKALEFYELYEAALDSISSHESKLKIKELELKYSAENFKNEIELLKRDNKIKSLRLTWSRIGIISLIIILTLAGIIWSINLKRNRLKRDTNNLLTQKNLELEAALRKLKDSEINLKELNAAKDKFFSIIGHDLRNPLNALLGFSELISGNTRQYTMEEIRMYNKIINDAARNMHQLIENLLDWSRSQSGSIDFSPRYCDLLQVTNDIQKIFDIQISKKNIGILNNIPVNMKVFADKNLLSTILRNLINNAIKFTPQGGYITLSAEKSNGYTNITVADTGIGMTREQLSNLFKLDTNLTKAGTSQEKGTGLGLILCKEFVEIHKGSIKVESEPDKGSIFTFSLPYYE
jgi:signal transduction histidine kinase/tetratricopeptide (TPR) repeat protein